MQAILGVDTLQGKQGPVPISSLEGKYVFIYFSAHWCPPCRGFTPVLAEFYKANAASKNFEIIFVSSDRDQKSFDEYYGEMPWLALPFNKRAEKDQVSGNFQVKGIPTLILFGPDGKMITNQARGNVTSDKNCSNFPWA